MTTNDQHAAHQRLFALLKQENVNDIALARDRIRGNESVLKEDEKRFLTRAARSWRRTQGPDAR